MARKKIGGNEVQHQIRSLGGGGERNNHNPKNCPYITCYEYHLYLSKGQKPEYIHV
jgi:hypothetical protein